MGELDQGTREAKTALASLQKAVGPKHRWIVAARSALGECLVAAGKSKEAIEPLERAVEQQQGSGHPVKLAKSQFALARALWESGGNRARARKLAKEAERAYVRAPGEPRMQLKAIRAWLDAQTP